MCTKFDDCRYNRFRDMTGSPKIYKSWLTPKDRVTQRVARSFASHPDVIVLCTKLDTECDRQTTVLGRLLTTLGDDRRAVTKLFLVQRLEKSSRGNYTYFWRYSNLVFVW